jgi:signal transduction histidine kinase
MQIDTQFLVSLLQTIADPLLILDPAKRVVSLNNAAEQLFPQTDGPVIGKAFSKVTDSPGLSAFVHEQTPLDEWSPNESSAYIPRIQPIMNADQQVAGYMLVLRDITRFKQLNRNQSEFMRIVSHDLRSPLTSMQGFASMLEQGLVGELNEKQSQFVEKILSGITQITALVDNIQDAGRFDPETGFYEMTRSQCDLAEIVQRIVSSHLVPAEKQELGITVHVDPDVPIINADVNMLERAITNLVDNAIKYTPNGGKIEVAVRMRDEGVVLSVKDTGLGISAENQKQLFQRHVRISRQEFKKIKGSGLGLFIVRSVAQRHGGDAWVESVEGQGTTFFFSIPLSGKNLIGAT